MRTYGVAFVGSVFVEAGSPVEAFEAAKGWSDAILRASVNGDLLPADGVEIVIIKPQPGNIQDATDMIREMQVEAGVHD